MRRALFPMCVSLSFLAACGSDEAPTETVANRPYQVSLFSLTAHHIQNDSALLVLSVDVDDPDGDRVSVSCHNPNRSSGEPDPFGRPDSEGDFTAPFVDSAMIARAPADFEHAVRCNFSDRAFRGEVSADNRLPKESVALVQAKGS